jgi:hypothetical protein
MKKLTIAKLDIPSPSLERVSDFLDQEGTKTRIETVNWNEFPYQPDVTFAMGYDETHIFLKFYVKEQHIRAMETEPNGNVWEDSCCEFFCAFDDKGYYNLETNCIGTQLLGFGPSKESRERFSAEVIHSIEKTSTLGRETFEPQSGNFDYQLTMIIPASAYREHPNMTFRKGMTFKANFYKCGDKTPEPHFVSWNPIEIEQPNFHRPDFFGEVELG